MSVLVEQAVFAELYCPTCEKSGPGEGTRCPKCTGKLVKLVAATDSFVGRELDGRFTVLEKLGQGGMGAVYRAQQHSVGREVAIKVVHANRMSDPAVIKRFLREAKLLSRLSHPNAVGVLDFGQTPDGVFYLVMELVSGKTLDKELEATGVFAGPRVVRIGTQICDALDVAHGLQIVHRDLKPSNIMLMATGRDVVKVLDFGLATTLEDNTENDSRMLGTPAFISPERINGSACDGRADLYSLGCILYLLGTGHLPFRGTTAQEMVAMHAHREVPAMSGVHPALAAVVEQLLAKDPRDRFQTAAEVRQALDVALASFAIDGELGPMPQRRVSSGPLAVVSSQTLAAATRPPKKRWPWVLLALAAAAALAVGIGFSMSDHTQARASTPAVAAEPQKKAKKRTPRPEDELAEVGGPPRTVNNGTAGGVAKPAKRVEASTPDETKPVTSDETKPVVPDETRPVAPPETKPVAPPESRPVAPVETTPVAPPETRPEKAPEVATKVEPKKPDKPPPPPARPAVEERPGKRAAPEVPKKTPPAKKVKRPKPAPPKIQKPQKQSTPPEPPPPPPEPPSPKLPF